MDIYSKTVGGLSPSQYKEALAFADAGVVVLLDLQRKTRPGGGLHPQIADPIGASAEIHQATGMVTIQASVKLADALVLLRAHAYAAERPVIDSARAVVSGRMRFQPEDDHHE